jgi:hypothetical protein
MSSALTTPQKAPPTRVARTLLGQLWLPRVDVFLGILVLVLSFCAFRRAPMQQMGDSRYAMLLADNLLRHGDFALDRYRLPAGEYQIEHVGGHDYYSFPPGTSLLSVPLVALGHLKGWSAVQPDGTYSLPGEAKLDARLSALLMAAFAALAYFTARVLLPPSPSLVVASVAAFGTQVFSTTSRSMWSDTWGILIVGGAAFLLLRAAARSERANLPLVGTLEAIAYVVRPTNAVVLVGTGLYLVWTRRRDVWQFIVAAGAWLALFCAYSWRHFHTLLPSYYAARRLRFDDVPTSLLGNLVSPSRGLLVDVPATVAIGLLLVVYWRAVRLRGLLALCSFVVVGHLVVLSGFDHWWGGHCFGARLTASLVPWIVLSGVIAFEAVRVTTRAQGGRAWTWAILVAAAVLCAASVVINSVGAFSQEASRWNYAPEDIDETPARLWSLRRPQFLASLVEPDGPYLPLPAGGLSLGAREADRYLGLGWAPFAEGEWRWTDGRAATLRFALEGTVAGVADLELRPYLASGKIAAQRLVISINARDVGELSVSAPDFVDYHVAIPADATGARNVLRLRLPDALSPAAAEGARDHRDLGVAVRMIRWRPR